MNVPSARLPSRVRQIKSASSRDGDGVVYVGILLLIVLVAVWQITQFEAVEGSWWSVFFEESGPFLLPVIFAVLLGLGYFHILSATRRKVWRVAPACFAAMVFVAYVWLTIPLAYLHGFDQLKIWKDVAFASAYGSAPLIYGLSLRRIVRLSGFWVWLSFAASLLALAEAVRREIVVYQMGLGHFLQWTYRVFAGGGIELMYFSLGYVIAVHGQNQRPPRALTALLVYGTLRFALNYTRLNWITAAVVIGLFAAFFARRRSLATLFRFVLIGALIFFIVSIAVLVGTAKGLRVSEHPLLQRVSSLADAPTEDVSVRFRMTEARILLVLFTDYPVSGWGPGGTISPNDPDEPERNEISVFFNGYPGLLYKFGLVGTALFLSAFSLTLWEARRALRYSNVHPAIAGPLGGFSMLVLVGFVGTLFTDTIFANMGGVNASLFIGAICAISRRGVTFGASGN